MSLDLPEGLPAPVDDGACDHLPGMAVPKLDLPSTEGGTVDLAALGGRSVVFGYPRTGRPGAALPEGWDAIPGARGCTPQTCGFRDEIEAFRTLGVSVYGLSTQDPAYQSEMAGRLGLSFPVLSDTALRLTEGLRLPTMEVDGMILLKRVTLVLRDGRIEAALYPVFPPDRSAADTLAWLRAHP